MTSKEFVLWLKGFTEGAHEFNITPKQWDILKEKLAEVKDDSTLSPFPFGVPNTAPIVTLPHITPGPPVNPYNPYTITCSSGSFGTISTAYGYPSGSAWYYTTNTYNPPYTTGGEDEVIKTKNED